MKLQTTGAGVAQRLATAVESERQQPTAKCDICPRCLKRFAWIKGQGLCWWCYKGTTDEPPKS